MEHRLIYLASPYSHTEASVREDRFRAACEAAGGMMKAGYRVFSPIAHTHPIAVTCDLPKGFDYWGSYDRVMLESCSHLVILMIDGWMQSTGVEAERRIAGELGIPVLYAMFFEAKEGVDPDTYMISNAER